MFRKRICIRLLRVKLKGWTHLFRFPLFCLLLLCGYAMLLHRQHKISCCFSYCFCFTTLLLSREVADISINYSIIIHYILICTFVCLSLLWLYVNTFLISYCMYVFKQWLMWYMFLELTYTVSSLGTNKVLWESQEYVIVLINLIYFAICLE